jgi:hypothetical protein
MVDWESALQLTFTPDSLKDLRFTEDRDVVSFPCPVYLRETKSLGIAVSSCVYRFGLSREELVWMSTKLPFFLGDDKREGRYLVLKNSLIFLPKSAKFSAVVTTLVTTQSAWLAKKATTLLLTLLS